MEFTFNLEIPKDLAALFAAIGGLIAVFRGLFEYTKQGAEKRADRFFKLEKEFFSDESAAMICKMLDTNSEKLATLSYEEKIKFLGFFEQVAILVNSKLVKLEVASYVYGHYAISCADNSAFWTPDMDRESPYWQLFFSFAKRMKETPPKSFKTSSLRF